jgi:signal transduction histidine kinase
MGQTLERSWHELDEATRSEFLRSINHRAAALGEMVSELLDVSELDAADGRLQSETVELSDLLARTLAWVPVALGARELRMDVAAGLQVKGDAKLLGRVIDQLLSNAAKHTPEGTTVTVSAFSDGAGVTVSIADDGPGLSPEDLVRVGDRFHRGGTLNERVSGLGLGLALAHEILMLHGSRLEVQSEPGYGARFWFVLRTDG